MAFFYGMVGGSMEIVTLIKANICHKKETFISIFLLMILVSMTITAILSLNDSCDATMEAELNYADAGNQVLFMKEEDVTDSLLCRIREHELVEKVTVEKIAVSTIVEFPDADEEIPVTWFVREISPKYRVMNETMTDYETNPSVLKEGEIYIPQGVQTRYGCKAGERLNLTIGGKVYEFKIKGFIVEPINGSYSIGWKQVFVSEEDWKALQGEINAAGNKEQAEDVNTASAVIVSIYKAACCCLGDEEFAKQINLDTGIGDMANGSMTGELSSYYTTLFPETIGSIMMAFMLLLVIAVLIVVQHSVANGIEMEYVDLGILKSQGFTQEKIRLIWLLQYLSVQAAGAVVGMILAIPLTRLLTGVFQPIMAVIIRNSMAWGTSMLMIAAILVVSMLFLLLATRKISSLSPMKAIGGAKEEVYFDSRLHTPITKKGLSASLAFRQFAANKWQYTGVILIASILVFFMMTIMLLSRVFDSAKVMELVGVFCSDLSVGFCEEADDRLLAEVEKTVEKHTRINQKVYQNECYMSVNGEKLFCMIFGVPESITSLIEGRRPLYDNEIVITKKVAEILSLEIGDEVTVSYKDKKEEYLITGLFQSLNDTGKCFAMLFAGAEKFDLAKPAGVKYRVEDTTVCQTVADELNERWGDVLSAEAMDGTDASVEMVQLVVNAMQVVVYVISVIFVLIVVHMVCAKTFLRERTDIGIYKAVGFTSRNLRLQFAIRFLVIALLGSVIGAAGSVLGSEALLEKILYMIGISNLDAEYSVLVFAVPIGVASVCFFVFSYAAARQIKKVETKELVIE